MPDVARWSTVEKAEELHLWSQNDEGLYLEYERIKRNCTRGRAHDFWLRVAVSYNRACMAGRPGVNFAAAVDLLTERMVSGGLEE